MNLNYSFLTSKAVLIIFLLSGVNLSLLAQVKVIPPERFDKSSDTQLMMQDSAGSVEQTDMGTEPSPELIYGFDGMGEGFKGPDGEFKGRNPSDNSLAVGPNHIVQTVNSMMAIFTKTGSMYPETGKTLYGPAETNRIFKGFGGPCENINNGDAVIRYDQLANRWLLVMPLFRKTEGKYGMCYAVSTSEDPMGSWYRYEFKRDLFPDYPRPAVWPDGYYIPTSTGDHVIQKHVAVVDRNKMLRGEYATEQMVVIDSVNFLNTSDLVGRELPPEGSPNIIIATGGSQLQGITSDDGIYVWKYHVDWKDPDRSKIEGPAKIEVAPYVYLGGGQLTEAIPQPGVSRRLDSQGDKIMANLIYRRIGGQQSLVAVHSVKTLAGGGGVRWYEFRINRRGSVDLFQQGTYAPDENYRWMASPAMDAAGNIGIGYSFGGSNDYAGQRFAGRLASDPKGRLPMKEIVLVKGEEAQQNTNRWQDYTQTAMDPDDDMTIWYVGDYLKKGASSYSTRIGAFRLGKTKE